VGLKSAEDAENAYETILGNARKYKFDAKIEGVQVQQMLAGGTEVIVGSITDASFGKLVAFGLGGVLVEVLKDITFRLAPATKQDALSMLDGIQAHEILKGVRGGEPVNRTALADVTKGVIAAQKAVGLTLEEMTDTAKVKKLSTAQLKQLNTAYQAFNATTTQRNAVVKNVKQECKITLK
jgi:hypothetical protein